MLSNRKYKQLQVYFCRELAALMRTGFMPAEAVEKLAHSSPRDDWRLVFASLSNQVFCGSPLHQAMQRFASIFDPTLVQLVRSGEQNNSLPHNLDLWYQWYVWNQDWQRRIRKVASYPLISLTLVTTALLLAAFFLAPNILVFAASDDRYSPVVKWIIGCFTRPHYVAIGLATGVAALWWLVVKARLIEVLILRVGLLRDSAIDWQLTKFFATMATLQDSRVRVDIQLSMACSVITLTVLQNSWKEVQQRILNGESLAQAIAGNRLIPQSVIHFTTALNQQRDQGNIWRQLASYFEQQTSARLQKVEPLVEPVVTLFSGLLIVAFLAVFILPLY